MLGCAEYLWEFLWQLKFYWLEKVKLNQQTSPSQILEAGINFIHTILELYLRTTNNYTIQQPFQLKYVNFIGQHLDLGI